MLVDTHCHLADPAFEADRDAVLARAGAAGVGHIVAIGESPAARRGGPGAGRREPRLSATAGLHPHDARHWSAEQAPGSGARCRHPRVVAVGETGLDYHYDHSPREQQRAAFEAQLELAARDRPPGVIHAREADDDVLCDPAESSATPSRSCIPSAAVRTSCERGLALGHYVSFSGMITFQNWRRTRHPRDAARPAPGRDRRAVPRAGADRGKRNEPAFVRHVAERIAGLRGLRVDELIARTGANAASVFGLRL